MFCLVRHSVLPREPEASPRDCDIIAGMNLTADERDLIVSALDSHIYWHLSDPHYRNNGAVEDPGSDDPENADEIAACRELSDKLAELDLHR